MCESFLAFVFCVAGRGEREVMCVRWTCSRHEVPLEVVCIIMGG